MSQCVTIAASRREIDLCSTTAGIDDKCAFEQQPKSLKQFSSLSERDVSHQSSAIQSDHIGNFQWQCISLRSNVKTLSSCRSIRSLSRCRACVYSSLFVFWTVSSFLTANNEREREKSARKCCSSTTADIVRRLISFSVGMKAALLGETLLIWLISSGRMNTIIAKFESNTPGSIDYIRDKISLACLSLIWYVLVRIQVHLPWKTINTHAHSEMSSGKNDVSMNTIRGNNAFSELVTEALRIINQHEAWNEQTDNAHLSSAMRKKPVLSHCGQGIDNRRLIQSDEFPLSLAWLESRELR